MSFAVANTIATGFVSSRLDYCNSLYHNIAINAILKLQPVKKILAMVVTLSLRFSRSVPLLKSLHWFPVRYRIIFEDLYNYLSSTFIQTTNIFTVTDHC